MEKWQNAQKMVAPLLDLEILKISSPCSERTLTFLLFQCLNVKEIYMGMTTCVSDQVFSDVLTKNSLSRLERLKIQKCSKVSDFTLNTTTQYENCKKLLSRICSQKLRENIVFLTFTFCKLFSRKKYFHGVFLNPAIFSGIKILFHTVFSHKNCTYFFVKRQLFLQ